MWQCGYRKGKSTIDSVDRFVMKVLRIFENKALAQVTLCDLSKVFDCVCHLLCKLDYYGFSGTVLTLF